MQNIKHSLSLKRLGISTYKEAVIYIRKDSYICKAEGFEAQSRLNVRLNGKSIIATLNTITSDLLSKDEASLSDWAWDFLGAKEGDLVYLSHPSSLDSMNHIRAKIYGKELDTHAFNEIASDVVEGHLSDIQISAFLSACAGQGLTREEIVLLTNAMLNVGHKINWGKKLIVDKHCIGGLPGNRTTPIIVPIVAAFGLTIPKTSSRAITSSAGTADTMETLAPVELDFEAVKSVVDKENGCIVWGDAAELSPADDIMIRVERVLSLDSPGQIVASVLSKKVAAGSTHVLIDIPVGSTSKVRNQKDAEWLKSTLEFVGEQLGLKVKTIFTDGTKPVGRGIGPALEAYDVLAVLQNKPEAPEDLRERSLLLAGKILEFSSEVNEGEGLKIAREILISGKAWQKFRAICEAQGGMRIPPRAAYTYTYVAPKFGMVNAIDNRRIARLAKLAGAPNAKAAGVYLHVNVGSKVDVQQPLLTIHAESPGELDYAQEFLRTNGAIVQVAS